MMALGSGWLLVVVAFAYVGGLFLVAWIGDRFARAGARPLLYALSLAVFCTSWTFFGSVGLAAGKGYDFVPVYLGPILVFTLGWPFIRHIVRVAKRQNITSVADFLAARYGRSQALAATVAIIAVIATLPYIALQLKAIVLSSAVVFGLKQLPALGGVLDPALIAALLLATFATLFGTRHVDATEHQDGMMLAVAVESLIKLLAFLLVGGFVLFVMFGGPTEFVRAVGERPPLMALFANGINAPTWVTVTVLSLCAILLLPRQFHVTVVENKHPDEVKTAAWVFPLYLVAINLFVIPIAAAGLTVTASAPPDTFVLALPASQGADLVSLVAFIGGLSAATAMVIVDSIALAIMITNGLVAPLLLRGRVVGGAAGQGLAGRLLMIRRASIFAVILLGYSFYLLLSQSAPLASIGLVAFAAIAQLAPAFFAGFLWRGGTARGAISGMLLGFCVWAWTLIVPWIAQDGLIGAAVLTQGPFGLSFLAPQAMFGVVLDPLSHGVFWSLTLNTVAFVGVSLISGANASEVNQAEAFAWGGARAVTAPTTFDAPQHEPGTRVTVGELETALARYLGAERIARSLRQFEFENTRRLDPSALADKQLLRAAERMLTSAIGPASSRLIMTSLLARDQFGNEDTLELLDAAEEALQFNRDLLQSSLDQVQHGIAVFDKEQHLAWWNRQFRDLMKLPAQLGQPGVHLYYVLAAIGERRGFNSQKADQWAREEMKRLASDTKPHQENLEISKRLIDMRTAPTPQGGVVVTFADFTEQQRAAEAQRQANEQLRLRVQERSDMLNALEGKVRERTADLSESNRALQVARTRADEANLDKTRFLAAASHDVLQPLNAARLYADSLAERVVGTREAQIAGNIEASLDAVEEILGALVDIARLDTGRMDPEATTFPLNELFEQLKVEFAPLAKERKLDLRIIKTSVYLRTDRRLLRRVMQNLVSNALKYTRTGGVVVGVRRKPRGKGGTGLGNVLFQVSDTGPGIPKHKQEIIFREFQRLEETANDVRGLGLGLSIVDRITRKLQIPVAVSSKMDRGSTFTLEMARAMPVVAPATPRAGAQNTLPAPAARRTQLTGLTVLVIDNDPGVLDAMDTLLLGWGCRVHKAESTKGALDVLYSGDVQPDLVLSDYHLDLGNGIDAVQAVRVRLGVSVPAVILTADASPEVQRAARDYGCAVLRKPVRAAALRALVNQLALQAVAAE
jgi:Na+/proline symporter/signal transduction histidine kinase